MVLDEVGDAGYPENITMQLQNPIGHVMQLASRSELRLSLRSVGIEKRLRFRRENERVLPVIGLLIEGGDSGHQRGV